jgi:hypothetical protein
MENNKEPRLCPITNQPLPNDAHGNQKYFPADEVQKTAKQQNNNFQYGRVKNLINQAKRLDDILERHYSHSQGSVTIKKHLLDLDGFAWDFNSGQTSLGRQEIFWILDYGYSFINKKKIIIYYGANPLQQF